MLHKDLNKRLVRPEDIRVRFAFALLFVVIMTISLLHLLFIHMSGTPVACRDTKTQSIIRCDVFVSIVKKLFMICIRKTSNGCQLMQLNDLQFLLKKTFVLSGVLFSI